MTMLDVRRRMEVAVRLPCHVVDTEGDFGVYTGETVRLGITGVVARLPGPLPSTCETTAQVELPDGSEVVTNALVVEGSREGQGWTYRLVFPDLEVADVRAIESLLAA